MFGPLPDVPNGFMGGSYQPQFREAVFCSGCHEDVHQALVPGTQLAARFSSGLPVHSTYTEWQEAGFSQGMNCQACHMPLEEGLYTALDVATPADYGMTFGFGRAKGELRQHVFRGPLSETPAFVTTAATLDLQVTPAGPDTLAVDVSVFNAAAGHAIPTGEPMRSMILVVDVPGCPEPLVVAGGPVLDDVGGALATGTLGIEASLAGTAMDWPEAAALAKPGDVIRAVSETGAFLDYDGVGLFAAGVMPAAEKGWPELASHGEATVVSIAASVLTLDVTLTAPAGATLYLGEPPLEGDGPSRALAGLPGASFAKVLLAPDGERQTPHYRAVDIVRDNRIRPLLDAPLAWTLTLPAACVPAQAGDGSLRARLLYRPHPLRLASRFAWTAEDLVMAEATAPF